MAIRTLEAPDAQSLYSLASMGIVDEIIRSFRSNGVCRLGLVGGRTIPGLLRAVHLQIIARKEFIREGLLEVYWLDERLDAEKNFFPDVPLIERLANAGIPIVMRPIVSTTPAGARDEAARILDRLPGFDLVICSAGEDGHIASLFPGMPQLRLKKRGYAIVEDAPKPPADRITATPPLLISARRGYLFFVGEKREAYRKFLDPYLTPNECPAKLLMGLESLTLCVALRGGGKRFK